ncbi:unnamed protein product [Lactuca virosa]|uniref:Uncharacterized protein n=1 Tax=Lactuca virosa TaxID=75947 RepID=A0AAU9P1V4_9ASTR|nr:unnamed protein product [Lactuca virosa]
MPTPLISLTRISQIPSTFSSMCLTFGDPPSPVATVIWICINALHVRRASHISQILPSNLHNTLLVIFDVMFKNPNRFRGFFIVGGACVLPVNRVFSGNFLVVFAGDDGASLRFF